MPAEHGRGAATEERSTIMGIMGITVAGEPPQRPESEIPGIAASPPIRVVGDVVAAAIGPVECYSNGLSVVVSIWSRQAGVAQQLFQQLTRGGPTGNRVGFRFGDGATVWHPRSTAASAQSDEPVPGLELAGGRASETRLDLQFWLTPAPGAELACVVDLPDHGLRGAQLLISGDLLLEGSSRAEPLWS